MDTDETLKPLLTITIDHGHLLAQYLKSDTLFEASEVIDDTKIFHGYVTMDRELEWALEEVFEKIHHS